MGITTFRSLRPGVLSEESTPRRKRSSANGGPAPGLAGDSFRIFRARYEHAERVTALAAAVMGARAAGRNKAHERLFAGVMFTVHEGFTPCVERRRRDSLNE